MFHSAAWRHDVELRGARVALLGSGASAVQIAPQIQPVVGELAVYQRTPPWILPHPDRPIRDRERALYRAVPPAQRAMRSAIAWAREAFVLGFRHPWLSGPGERLARSHLERQVSDPRMREALRPAYRLGCKRVLISNRYYPTLIQPNVTLVPHAVTEVRPHSLVAGDGVERPAEVIVAATGFRVTDSPASQRIRGRDGRTLAEHWKGSPQAYKGTTIAGFPNLFMLLGPHTGLGHTSVLLMIESQIDYVLGALRAMDERRIAALEPRPAAQAAFVAAVRRRARGTVWGEWRLRELVSGRRRALGALAGLVVAISTSAAPLRPHELPRAAVQFELAMSSEEQTIEAPGTRRCRICSVEINKASARCPYCGARQHKHQPIIGARGLLVCLVAVAVAVFVTRAVVDASNSGLRYVPYRSADLAALVPSGYRDLLLTGPHGTAIAGWGDPGRPGRRRRRSRRHGPPPPRPHARHRSVLATSLANTARRRARLSRHRDVPRRSAGVGSRVHVGQRHLRGVCLRRLQPVDRDDRHDLVVQRARAR